MDEKQEEPQTPVRNPIITFNDPERYPLLEMVSQSCGLPLDAADEQAIIDMDDLLNQLDTEAAGLAAVQIGVPRRIFLLRNGFDEETKQVENNVYINPEIISKSKETKKGGEGCLSLPGVGASFPRPKQVTLSYMDFYGEFHQETFTGFWARAVCHEMDHLNATLITKHLEKQLAKQVPRNKFGMKLTPQSVNRIAKRRQKKKRAKAANKKHAKAIGR